MAEARAPSGPGLVRGIRHWDLVGLIINNVIGAGIFGLPAALFALAGTYSLFAFIACAFVIGIVGLCFAEMATRFTETGGPYLYARKTLGPLVGFEVGWLHASPGSPASAISSSSTSRSSYPVQMRAR